MPHAFAGRARGVHRLLSVLLLHGYAVAHLLPSHPESPPLKQRIAVPSYFYPCHDTEGGNAWENCAWDVMNNSTPPVDYAILNPDDGPGTRIDPNYVAQVARSRAVGLGLLGYVSTLQGEANSSTVMEAIDTFYKWYNVDGIFLDQVATDCATLQYYSALAAHIRQQPGGRNNTVVINPGANTQECFASAADIIVNFDGPYDAYQSWQPAGWESSAPASKFWHMIYAADGNTSEHAAAVKLSKQRNAGWVYITDQTLPHPYAALPEIGYLWDIIRWASNEI